MSIADISPVSNPELIKAINKAKEEPNQENSVRMLNEVVRAKLLIPVSMDGIVPTGTDKNSSESPDDGERSDDEMTQISFELIKAGNGDIYYPVFTDIHEMRKCAVDKNQASIIVNFDDLAAMLLQPMNAVAGFAINPMSDNVCFNVPMIAAMKKDMDKENDENGK